MAWVNAEPTLVSIVTATVPTNTEVFKERFAWLKDEATVENAAPTSRSFWFGTPRSIVALRLYRRPAASWTRAVIDLVICYRKMTRTQAVVRALFADHLALSTALQQDADWGRPTSTITKIGEGVGETLFPAIVEDANKALLMKIAIPIDFRAA